MSRYRKTREEQRAADDDDLRFDRLEEQVARDAPVRDAQGTTAARIAMGRAQHLAGLVRECGPDRIGAYLDGLTLDQLYATITALAAMVPDDVPVSDLLGWLDAPKDTAA